MSSLVLLPTRNFTVFERQYLNEYYTQRAKNLNMLYQVSLALQLPEVSSYLTCCLLYAKPYANEQKFQIVTSAWIPLLPEIHQWWSLSFPNPHLGHMILPSTVAHCDSRPFAQTPAPHQPSSPTLTSLYLVFFSVFSSDNYFDRHFPCMDTLCAGSESSNKSILWIWCTWPHQVLP